MNLQAEKILSSLLRFRKPEEQQAFIIRSGLVPSDDFVEELSDRIRALCPRDPTLAETLADTSFHLATELNTPQALAFANRSRADVLYTMRRCAEARPLYDHAIGLFRQAGNVKQLGRTLCAQMDNLIYLSEYDAALKFSQEARGALEESEDIEYLVTLDIALGNLYYRLNRYIESLEHYDRARSALEESTDFKKVAAVGLNRSHVLTDMNRLDEAMESFETTKTFCDRHGLVLWSAIADNGIAKLQFMRGNYSSSLRILEQVRRRHEETGDQRRMGLCDKDQAETYLQLNLFEEAARLADRAFEIFEKLGNRYEAAICQTFKGIAAWNLGLDADAETAFVKARDMFVDEGNRMWQAVVDLWRAQVLLKQERFGDARRLAMQAADAFEKLDVPVQAAHARIVACHGAQGVGLIDEARAQIEQGLREIQGFHAPWVFYQCYHTLGKIREAQGDPTDAEAFYLKAIQSLESLHGNIGMDDLRLAFGRDKYQVYEDVVDLKIQKGEFDEAFTFVERSKSRTLIDLLERNLETVWDVGGEDDARLHQLRKMREELNALYSRLNLVGTSTGQGIRDASLQELIRKREQELTTLLRQASAERSGFASLEVVAPPTVSEIQAILAPHEVLVEFTNVRGRFHVFVIGKSDFQMISNITSAETVRKSLRGLSLQLSKFHLKSAYIDTNYALLVRSIQYHLRSLYLDLLAPIEHLVGDRSLVIVPHQLLHYVPFHALYDGDRYVIDRREVHYGASASVLKLCRERESRSAGNDLIVGAPDELTPNIVEEVQALAAMLPTAKVLEKGEARLDRIRDLAPGASRIHIAAHAVFRADNPMFSSIKLGEEWLSLFDIFNLRLSADLVTLSACETGMSAIREGDELLGLVRGFLYAGAPSLVVSLWTVSDRSTAELMTRFYTGLQDGLTKVAALRRAILAVKQDFPHPYYWAPFVLMGKPD